MGCRNAVKCCQSAVASAKSRCGIVERRRKKDDRGAHGLTIRLSFAPCFLYGRCERGRLMIMDVGKRKYYSSYAVTDGMNGSTRMLCVARNAERAVFVGMDGREGGSVWLWRTYYGDARDTQARRHPFAHGPKGIFGALGMICGKKLRAITGSLH